VKTSVLAETTRRTDHESDEGGSQDLHVNHDTIIREYESQEHTGNRGPGSPISGQLSLSQNAIRASHGVLIVIQNLA
jgi:hypothetical protein